MIRTPTRIAPLLVLLLAAPTGVQAVACPVLCSGAPIDRRGPLRPETAALVNRDARGSSSKGNVEANPNNRGATGEPRDARREPAERLPENRRGGGRSLIRRGPRLADAVADFNAKASRDPVGKSQPPLTEAEVVAAIRGWSRDQTPASDATYEAYQMIADSGVLPAGAELGFTTGWSGYRGHNFTVWWIDLEIPLDKEKTGFLGYTFRVRDRKISSRKMSAEELQRHGRMLKQFQRERKKTQTDQFLRSLDDEPARP